MKAGRRELDALESMERAEGHLKRRLQRFERNEEMEKQRQDRKSRSEEENAQRQDDEFKQFRSTPATTKSKFPRRDDESRLP